jgi:hypothetical protein
MVSGYGLGFIFLRINSLKDCQHLKKDYYPWRVISWNISPTVIGNISQNFYTIFLSDSQASRKLPLNLKNSC